MPLLCLFHLPPLLSLLLLFPLRPSLAQDWAIYGLGDPLASAAADPGPGRRWEIDWLLSDSFYYPNKSHPNFIRKWNDYDPTGWPGPGATLFSSGNVQLSAGKLVIQASSVPESERGGAYCHPPWITSEGCDCADCFKTTRRVHTGHLSSRKLVRYPCFVEGSFRINATPLSSNFWLKSKQTEIDVNESYGDGENRRVVKSNAHIFFRHSSEGVRSLNKQQSWGANVDLSEGFHRYATYWRNETFLEFYFDGLLIREMDLRAEGIFDPTGKYMNEGMRMIFDLEAHAWRGEEGVPSEDELADERVSRMEVDWVRTYYPVDI
eukprot:GFKZ01011149.1.p1 GENE.GFKZ01011149.1~~GFKZ01011149.1.p1  ORF type:complete len:321 (+),score=26.74 GFKZ01011149.1:263-1225(+)